MNGMRRFLGGGGGSSGHITPPSQDSPLPPVPSSSSTTTTLFSTSSPSSPPSGSLNYNQQQQRQQPYVAPLFSSSSSAGGKPGPSWPPSSPPHSPPSGEVHSPEQSPKTTAALFFRKDKQRPMRIPTDEEVPPLPLGTSGSSGMGGIGMSMGIGASGSRVSLGSGVSGSPRSSKGVLSPSRSQTMPLSLTSPNGVAGASGNSGVSGSGSRSGSRTRNSNASTTPTSSPPRVPPLPHRVSQLSKKSTDTISRASNGNVFGAMSTSGNGNGLVNGGGGAVDWKRRSGLLDLKDDLLMSLLASEAIVDSRGYEILSAEEVEDLKKEYQILSTRLTATSKKLSLETKIRDAAISLSKANASYKSVSKQTADQLDQANRKVDITQKELWKISERANEVQKRLLEHTSCVLSYSVRSLEKKLGPAAGGDVFGGNGALNGDGMGMGSGYSTPSRRESSNNVGGLATTPTSPSSIRSTSSSVRGRFDGAHFFAGHTDAVVPQLPRPAPTLSDILDLEEKLKSAHLSLEEEKARSGEVTKELSEVKREREKLEESVGMELRGQEEIIGSLEREISKLEDYEAQVKYLEGEREVWVKERAELEDKRRQVDILERRLQALEEQSGEAAETSHILEREREIHREDMEARERELEELKLMYESDRTAWDVERATLEGDITQSAIHARQEAEAESREELNEVFDALRDLMQTRGVLLVSKENSLTALISSVGTHIDGLNTRLDTFNKAQEEWVSLRAKLEDDVRSGLDKRESLLGELEKVKAERDGAKDEAKCLDEQLKEQARLAFTASPATVTTPVEYTGDAAAIVAILQPLWAVLPSPEARASRMGSRFTPVSPTNSPAPSRSGTSISEMDVRNLKILYDPRQSPLSPQTNGGANFSVEALVERVKSLISDDRALIERLIRFAQAHDLLKKNAERAQKLALESNGALETYQKQVKMLEERNLGMINKQAAYQDEIQHLQDAIDRITLEKIEVENHAAEQAETCAQLSDANNKLSARALLLADDAATTHDGIRKQLETQLTEVNAALAKAKAEVESMRQSQQSQQMALMEELNSVQTENDNLRAQLRSKK